MTIGGAGLKRRWATVACVGFLLISSAGCAVEPTPVQPSATPTAEPVFASDEEALAAATEAYANYLKAYDLAWAEGTWPMTDYLALSTGEAHEDEAASLAKWEEEGWHATGTTSFDSIRLQSREFQDGVQSINTYLCLDISNGDVVDQNGNSVAKPDRPMRLPLEVTFDATSSHPSDMRVSRSEVWSGKNFC
jgi:hypothetical protein